MAHSSDISNDRGTQINHNNQEISDPRRTIVSSQTQSRQGKVDFEKWKINFNGTGNVVDFLFNIDTLVDRTQCSFEQLEDNFQTFLSVDAERWYWEFIKRHNDPPYRLLKKALLKEFASSESDDDILYQMNSRKQSPRVSYDDFHSAILAMNSRMKVSITENRLVNIIRKNVIPELKVMLFNSKTNNLHTLRDVARNAEKILKENKTMYPTKIVTRHINELEIQPEDIEFEEDPQIEAMEFSQRTVKPDYSHIKCWNCLTFGHSYIYCPEETRALFCYKCGERNVSTTKCKNTH